MFRWGIIGAGYAARKFVLGLRASDGGAPALVCSRSEANARAFARDFGIAGVRLSVEDAVRSPEVDAFYIATPPTAHRDQAIACLSAGKAYAGRKALRRVAWRRRGDRCGGAILGRFLHGGHVDALPAARRGVADDDPCNGAIGTPRSLSGGFGASNLPDPGESLFNPDLAGGALLHRGIYPLAMAFDLLGEAELAAAAARQGATGVDEDCILALRHENGALSTVRASLRAPLPNDLTIEGEHGFIHVHAPIFRPFRLTLSATRPASRAEARQSPPRAIARGRLGAGSEAAVRGLAAALKPGGRRTVTRTYAGNGYHYEADEVMRCVQRGAKESAVMPLEQSLAMATLIDKARASWAGQRPE